MPFDKEINHDNINQLWFVKVDNLKKKGGIMITSFFRMSAFSEMKESLLLRQLQKKVSYDIESVKIEWKFYVESKKPLTKDELKKLEWLLSETFEPEKFGPDLNPPQNVKIFEVGPRKVIVSPWSTKMVSICHSCGLDSITRVERTRRYCLEFRPGMKLSDQVRQRIFDELHDRMTEEPYLEPLTTFDLGISAPPAKIILLLEEGETAFDQFCVKWNLSFTKTQTDYIINHYVNVLRRNPTDVEIFTFAQLNSEHCRHGKFNGRWIIDGQPGQFSLMEMIRQTAVTNPEGVIVAFKDNAAIIQGGEIPVFAPEDPTLPSPYSYSSRRYHYVFKVETHNHPCAIAAGPGSDTGIGGVVRDILGVGRGGQPTFSFAGYFVSHLLISNYPLPWEERLVPVPENFQHPVNILIGASNGASNYSNQLGIPVILGTTTSCELKVDKRFFGYHKPIVVVGTGGLIDDPHAQKLEPVCDLVLFRLGGDAYAIGLGGGSGSSQDGGESQKDKERKKAELDFNSVQRGNAIMEKVGINVIKRCSLLGPDNPIWTVTDSGAGGACVATPEIVFPKGADVYLRKIPCGDKTMAPLVYFCNESQEIMFVLVSGEKLPVIEKICQREKCPYAVVGKVRDDGRFILFDEEKNEQLIDLTMDFLLADLPQEEIVAEHVPLELTPLKLPTGLTIEQALKRTSRLPKVCSKEFLTRKADRSVSGRVAQQQCVGPLQLPLADCAVFAASFKEKTGLAAAIGDQPIKGIVNRQASVRMAVGEALTNLIWASLDKYELINISGNWMWPCRQPGEDALLYDAVEAVTHLIEKELGLRISVGKDSLSMTAKTLVEKAQEIVEMTISAPGTLVATAFAPCDDITKTITPDLKKPGESNLLFIDLACGKQRLGGSALAQVYKQAGDEVPDVEDAKLLVNAFKAIQKLIAKDLILSGHDRSEGGLIQTLLEMSFAGNCGLGISTPSETDPITFLFNEELGLVIEYLPEHKEEIFETLAEYGLENSYFVIGAPTLEKQIIIRDHQGKIIHEDSMLNLRDAWRETSFKLDELQANPESSRAERKNTFDREGPRSYLRFIPVSTPQSWFGIPNKPKVAILREEGTNGEEEMAASFEAAGFEARGVIMTDILEGQTTLRDFRGIAFPGGFSFGDVGDAGKGWAGVIKFNDRAREEVEKFYAREDTFSLGVCNGCQVMALLGIVPWSGIGTVKQPRFIRNESEIFESRFVSVKILPSNSIFLQGMEDSILGIWVAHAEGKLHCPDKKIFDQIIEENLAPIRFVNDNSRITTDYPFNPNGSPDGIAALASPDGRHLAMMPHPERLFRAGKAQWPYWPPEWSKLKASPWLRLFQNVRRWC